MKTLEEIKEYLSTRCCKNEQDALAIQSLIYNTSKEYVAIQPYRDDLTSITFDQFKPWISSFNPTNGDVLTKEENQITTTFIVKEVVNGGYYTLASISGGVISTTSILIHDDGITKEATRYSKNKLLTELDAAGYVIIEKLNIIAKKAEPEMGKICRYSINNSEYGICIFDMIQQDGTVTAFAKLTMDGDLKFEYPVILGPKDKVSFYGKAEKDMRIMESALSKNEKTWFSTANQIDHSNAIFKTGVKVYYLDEKFKVHAITSRGSSEELLKLTAGNYMFDYDDIAELQDCIFREVRRIKSRNKMTDTPEITSRLSDKELDYFRNTFRKNIISNK